MDRELGPVRRGGPIVGRAGQRVEADPGADRGGQVGDRPAEREAKPPYAFRGPGSVGADDPERAAEAGQPGRSEPDGGQRGHRRHQTGQHRQRDRADRPGYPVDRVQHRATHRRGSNDDLPERGGEVADDMHDLLEICGEVLGERPAVGAGHELLELLRQTVDRRLDLKDHRREGREPGSQRPRQVGRDVTQHLRRRGDSVVEPRQRLVQLPDAGLEPGQEVLRRRLLETTQSLLRGTDLGGELLPEGAVLLDLGLDALERKDARDTHGCESPACRDGRTGHRHQGGSKGLDQIGLEVADVLACLRRVGANTYMDLGAASR